VLNQLALLKGKEFDQGGKISASGWVDKDLYKKLNNLPYYKQNPPKSLGREWVEDFFMHALNKSKIPTEDKMATVVMHMAEQIARVIRSQNNGKVLLTGGGAFNTFLVEHVQSLLPRCEIIIPSEEIVKYKEALIFAFLGVLRWEGKNNCLASVTGAGTNNKGGVIYLV
jgi:anhydro-N-acetylmuramic acid kinase